MTRTIAVEVARRGVTVNAIAPGLIDTDMTRGLPGGLSREGARAADRHARGRRRLRPLPRIRAGRLRHRQHPLRRRRARRLTPARPSDGHTRWQTRKETHEHAGNRGAGRAGGVRRRSRASAPSASRSRREATLEELSIDSLDLAELSQIVHDRFGVELRGADVADVKTVGDAVKLIAGRALRMRGVARHRRGRGHAARRPAPTRSTSAGARGSAASRTARAAARLRAARLPLGQGGAPHRPLHAARARGGRGGARGRRMGRRASPTTPGASAACSARGSAASARCSTTTTRCATAARRRCRRWRCR